jgi:hypothetical protein
MNRNDQPSDQAPESEDAELDYDWGGDGSDLNEPVRTHVEAALVASQQPYPPPLDELLRLGSPWEEVDIDARIVDLGFGQEHVPDLVRMTRDRALNTAIVDTDESWAPIHALTALADLDIGEYVAELVPLFDIDSEWFGEELPDILGSAGEPALEPLRTYVQDRTRWLYGRAHAAAALTAVGTKHRELRGRAVQILSDALERATDNDPTLNGFLVTELVDLKAVEALPAIRQAFEQNVVDESIRGDWGEVLKALKQPIDRDDPLLHRSRERREAQRAELRATLPPGLNRPTAPPPAAPKKSAASKQKTKRKMSAAARKTNKKKKRK